MKKIINGKMYNTETAKEMGSHWNGYPRSDFNYCEETLYRKKTGEYFLYGDGGAATCYSYSVGQNCRSGGEDIVPLTEEEAKTWAERSLDADEYIEIFGEVEE